MRRLYRQPARRAGYYNAAPLDAVRGRAPTTSIRQDTANWPKCGPADADLSRRHSGASLSDLAGARGEGPAGLPQDPRLLLRLQRRPCALRRTACGRDRLHRRRRPKASSASTGLYQSLLFRACRRLVWSDPASTPPCAGRQRTGHPVPDPRQLRAHQGRGDQRGRTLAAAWPGQACSYKIGHSVISALRDKAQKQLGGAFSLRALPQGAVLKRRSPCRLKLALAGKSRSTPGAKSPRARSRRVPD